MTEFSEPTVLYGLGAAKCGTTWLNRQLNDNPDVAWKRFKEFHYFNTDKAGKWAINIAHRKLAAVLKGNDPDKDIRIQHLSAQIGILEGDRTKDKRYRDFMMETARNHRLIADFCPAYAILKPSVFRRMSELFRDTRFLYIMRDPVDRAWSHLRMGCSRHFGTRDLTHRMMDDYFSLLEAGELIAIENRGYYTRTIRNLDVAGVTGHTLFLFYENLFSKSSQNHVCDWLGIQRKKFKIRKVVHPSASLELTDEKAEFLRTRYEPEYNAMRELFGQELPESWRF